MTLAEIVHAQSGVGKTEKTCFAFGSLSRRWMVMLMLVGLVVRLTGAFLYGTQDMEWWKAWGGYSVQNGLGRLYGAPDMQVLQSFQQGLSLREATRLTQNVVRFQAYRYERTEFPVVQPPIYLHSIYLSSALYRVLSGGLENNRSFNFCLNLEPILSSAMLALVIFAFVSRMFGAGAGGILGLLYWLNPLVILNAPVQGYRDPLCALFAVCSIVVLYHRRLAWAFVFLALAMMTKPQGVLIAPVVCLVGLKEHPLARNVMGWLAGFSAGILAALPFILNGQFFSMILGVLSITTSSNDISRQSLNLWWPLQYAYHVAIAIRGGSTGAMTALLGGEYNWSSDVPASTLTRLLGFDIRLAGAGLLTLFTILNLCYVARQMAGNRLAMIVAAGLQVYGYFILRVGIQINHYFLLIPLFTVAACGGRSAYRHLVAISVTFFLQDFLFYGLGRDFNPGVTCLSKLHLGWTTNLLALVNTVLFGYLCWFHYRPVLAWLNSRRHALFRRSK